MDYLYNMFQNIITQLFLKNFFNFNYTKIA